jgi:hypothetical protein
MVKEDIKIILNGMYYEAVKTPKESLGSILGIFLTRLDYMSDDAIRSNINEAILLVEELLDVKGDSRTKRMITNSRKYLSKDLNREQLIRFYIDMVMAGEGLSTLSGFGIAKTSTTEGKKKGKASQGLNAEKISLYDIE